MKGAAKITLIAACAAIVIGLALLAVSGSLLGGFDMRSFDTSDMEDETMQIDGSFKDIKIEFYSGAVHILPSEDGKCSLIAPQGSKMRTEYSIKGDRLEIKQKNENWISFGISSEHDMYLYLPELDYDSADITTASGDISIPDSFSLKSVSLETASGDLDCAAHVSNEVKCEGVSGKVSIQNVDCRKISVQSVSGAVSLFDVRADSIDAESISGALRLSDIDTDSLELSNVSGKVDVSGRAGRTDIETVSGAVVLSDFDTDELKVETTSGNLTIPKKLRAVTEFESVSGSLKTQ